MPANPNAAKGDVDKQVEKAEDLGYIGNKVDPNPNEAYTLTTGPNSPSAGPGRAEQVPATTEKDG